MGRKREVHVADDAVLGPTTLIIENVDTSVDLAALRAYAETMKSLNRVVVLIEVGDRLAFASVAGVL